MRGRAHLRFGGAGDGARPDVWPSGVRSLGVTIDVDEISGRRVA